MIVNEIFYSLQGEGIRAGEPSFFVRLAKCDLSCGFCDTEFESGKEMSNLEILEFMQQINIQCRWIVWTGGEPALQLTHEDVEFFHKHFYKQAIETSGGHRVPQNLDWITVSPKVAEHVLEKNFPNGCTELKYVTHAGKMNVPQPKITAQYYLLSPIFDGEKLNQKNIDHAIKLCLENPQWRLSLQSHKLLKVL